VILQINSVLIIFDIFTEQNTFNTLTSLQSHDLQSIIMFLNGQC